MEKINHRTVVGAVIFHQDKVLILKRSDQEEMLPGVWELPSGKKKAFESVKKALIREILEETGLSHVKIIKPISVFEYTVNSGEKIKDRVQINYLAEIGEGIVHLSHEHQEFAWIGLSDLKNYKMTEQIKKVITEAFAEKSKTTD